MHCPRTPSEGTGQHQPPPAPTSRALLPCAVSWEERCRAPLFPLSRQGAAWVSKICSIPPKTRTPVQGQGQQQCPRSRWLKTRGEVPAGALCLVVSIALQTPVLTVVHFPGPSLPLEQAVSPVQGVFHTGAHTWGLAPCKSHRARWALPHPRWEAPSPPQQQRGPPTPLGLQPHSLEPHKEPGETRPRHRIASPEPEQHRGRLTLPLGNKPPATMAGAAVIGHRSRHWPRPSCLALRCLQPALPGPASSGTHPTTPDTGSAPTGVMPVSMRRFWCSRLLQPDHAPAEWSRHRTPRQS